jgi:hypothetical protein
MGVNGAGDAEGGRDAAERPEGVKPEASRAWILGQRGRVMPQSSVWIAEWGLNLVVRGLSAGERDFFELELNRQEKKKRRRNIRGLLVAMTVVDENGGLLFKRSDAEELAELPAAILDPLFSAAVALSGIGPKDMEELEGKLQEAAG